MEKAYWSETEDLTLKKILIGLIFSLMIYVGMTESVCAGDGDATNQQYNLTYDNMEQGYVDATNFQIQIDAVQTGTYSTIAVWIDGQPYDVTPYVFQDSSGTYLKLIADSSIDWGTVIKVEIPSGTTCVAENGMQTLFFEEDFYGTIGINGKRVLARKIEPAFINLDAESLYMSVPKGIEGIKVDGQETPKVRIDFGQSGEEHEILIQKTEGNTVQTITAYRVGDVHVDEGYDVRDLVALKKIQKEHNPKSYASGKAADVNEDLLIDQNDLSAMRNRLLGVGVTVPDRTNLWELTEVMSVSSFNDTLVGSWPSGGFVVTAEIAERLEEENPVLQIEFECAENTEQAWLEQKRLWIQSNNYQIGYQGTGGVAKDELRWNNSGTIVQARYRTLNKYFTEGWDKEGGWVGYSTNGPLCNIKSVRIGKMEAGNWDRTNLHDLKNVMEVTQFGTTIDRAYGATSFIITSEIKEKLQPGTILEIEYECDNQLQWLADDKTIRNKTMWFDNNTGFQGGGGVAQDAPRWNHSGTIIQVTYETLVANLSQGWNEVGAYFNYYAAGPTTIHAIRIGESKVWTPEEAKAVNKLASKEEITSKRKEILTKGKFLYEGNDSSNVTYTSDWADEIEENSAIALIYSYDANMRNQPLIQLSTKIPGDTEVRMGVKIKGDYIEWGDDYLIVFTMDELVTMFELETYTQLEYVGFGNPEGNAYYSVYYLPESVLEELNEYEAQLDEDKEILHNYDGNLSNENSIGNAKKLYQYLQSIEGKSCLTGQQESYWIDGPDYEINYIEQHTGKAPAIRGLDFIAATFEDVTERALAWHEEGGIVTISWHTGIDFCSAFDESKADDLNWEEAFTVGTDTYNALLEGMDRAVPYLKELEDAGVPVLWRPFHEMDGGWFWWSRGGADNFVKLWQLMYSRYTDYWELDNLIWVLAYSNNTETDKRLWYPGDDYVDIVGADSYGLDNSILEQLYNTCNEIRPVGMPIVQHECDAILSEGESVHMPWTYFLTWHTMSLLDYNTTEHLSDIYNSDYFVTRDELIMLNN